MTKQLVLALSPNKEENNNVKNDFVDDNFINIENPTGIVHLFKILFRTNIKSALSLSNPDGFFYLQYLKFCILLFFIAFVFGSAPLAFINFKANLQQIDLDEENRKKGFFEMISLTSTINISQLYYVALALTILISAAAYYLLYLFC